MKHLRYFVLVLFLTSCRLGVGIACPVCEKQQPEVLRGITHGAGPQSDWDWVIVGVVAAIALVTLCLSLKYLIRPSEQDRQHIKFSFLH